MSAALRTTATGILAAAVLSLSACGSEPAEDLSEPLSVAGPLWQVTDIYLEPGEPSSIPPDAAGTVGLLFGESTATGSTGCAPLQARVGYHDAGETVPAVEATTVVFEQVEFGPTEEDCAGSDAWSHDKMTRLLESGAEFDLSMSTPTELVLTRQGEAVDRPSLRLVALR